jgi:hypothetical protein
MPLFPYFYVLLKEFFNLADATPVRHVELFVID